MTTNDLRLYKAFLVLTCIIHTRHIQCPLFL